MRWARAASWLMALAVGLGAFGAHALRDRLDERMTEVYRTAFLYHALHALGLFAVAWIAARTQNPRAHLAGSLFVAGILLFSGSLYALSVTGLRIFGAITPLGGVAFLAGWLLLAWISRDSSQ